ncbi:MAG: ester cyclase [Chloroflexota bacterium]
MNLETNQANKQTVWDYWQQLAPGNADTLVDIIAEHAADDAPFIGPHPINRLDTVEDVVEQFWRPLFAAFPDLKRETFIFSGGESNGRADGGEDGVAWVCGLGNFVGTFSADYLTIPANQKKATIRYGEFCRMEDGKIAETYVLLDIPDLMRHAGYPVMPPDRGEEGLWPAPMNNDGVLLDAQDANESEKSMQLIRAMIYDGLNGFDESELQSMGMADFFREDMQWYGPSGIGGNRSLAAFQKNHQQHWLHAFPDRRVQDLDSLFTEGRYMCASGWAGVIATHTGEYLDVPATGKEVRFNGIDIWVRDDEKITENWVFVDMIDLHRQFGIDLFERMRQQIK